MPARDKVKTFGLYLSAVKEMVEEQKLSKHEALSELKRFLGKEEFSSSVKETIARLEAIDDEWEFQLALGLECLRAFGKAARPLGS